MAEFIVGIDLGTTNTLACYAKKGEPRYIKFDGKEMLPSVLYVDEDKNIVVGKKAKQKGIFESNKVIRSSKTFMGDFDKKWTVNGRTFTPTQVATEILSAVRGALVKKLHVADTDNINAVITVPAYFNSNQIDETKKAGQKAGFNVLRIVTEPMAAAIAAMKGMDDEHNQRLMVVDLGGGTFDLSILKADIENHTYENEAVDGDRKLGGDDFDQKLFRFLKNIIEEDTGFDLSSLKTSGLSEVEYWSMNGRLLEEAEKIKIALSEDEEHVVVLENLFSFRGGEYGLDTVITRDEFDEICQDIYKNIFDRFEKFIKNNNITKANDIDEIILAGGSCYIPYIQNKIEAILGKTTNTEFDRSKLVVTGAWRVAEQEESGVETIKDILSHSLGLKIFDGKSEYIFSEILKAGSIYPCEASDVFTTSFDDQEYVDLEVFEAGSDCEGVKDISVHDYYGMLTLEGIEKAPKQVPQIKVTYSYDKSRILTVTAEDKNTGVKKTVKMKKGQIPKNTSIQKPIDFALLLDCSGSMCGVINKAKKACIALMDDMIDLSTHRMGLISFESCVNVRSNLTHDREKLHRALEKINVGGSTDLTKAFSIAGNLLESSERERIVIAVTDGIPDNEATAAEMARNLIRNGIKVVTIAVDRSYKETYLKTISSKDSAYKISNMDALQDTFKNVINSIMKR